MLVLVDVWPELTSDEQAIVTELVGREDGPVVVLPLHVDSVPAVSAHAGRVGHGTAQAVATVLDLGAIVATYDPARYGGLVDPYDVLELS